MKKRFSINFLLFSLIYFYFIPSCQAAMYSYDNPIAHNSLTSFIERILVSIQGIAGWVSVIFIVIGGVLYITAHGQENQLSIAKKTIVFSLIGFSLAVAGPSLLKEIKDILLTPGTAMSIDDANPILNIVTNIMTWVLTIVLILATISFVFSGLTYLSSQGDRSKLDKAKNIFVYSVTAVAIAGASLIIIKTIIELLEA